MRVIDRLATDPRPVCGIAGLLDLPSLVAAVASRLRGLGGPSAESLLRAQSKYHGRHAQYGLLDGDVPPCARVTAVLDGTEPMRFPCFAKPELSTVSSFAYRIDSRDHLAAVWADVAPKIAHQNRAYAEILQAGLLDSPPDVDPGGMIVEALIEPGAQITVDGFIKSGVVGIFGSTESKFLANGISFRRFDFPFACSPETRARIDAHCRRFVPALGLDNTLFNIEMVVGPARAQIIEINTRPSMQFVAMIAAVTGQHPLDMLVEILSGDPAQTSDAKHGCGTSFVQRVPRDVLVTAVPSAKHLATLVAEHPNVTITVLAKSGKRLSDYIQDTETFRYGFIDVLGATFDALDREHEIVKRKLCFKFDPPVEDAV